MNLPTLSAAHLDRWPPIQCFLSYAHGDEANLSFIDEFSSALKYFCFADRGRRIEVFVDHESIGWGEDWRESIRASIRGALVFIPIVTLDYFTRPRCREELLLFHDTASRLGVAELLLPVIVLGERSITSENSDQAVQIIAQRQYRSFREAVVSGTQSATWRRAILGLANDLVDAVEVAELRLEDVFASEDECIIAQTKELAANVEGQEVVEDAALDTLEQSLIAAAGSVQSIMDELSWSLQQFGQVVASYALELEGVSQVRARSVILKFVDAARAPAIRVGELGGKFEADAVEADRLIRQARLLRREYPIPHRWKAP